MLLAVAQPATGNPIIDIAGYVLQYGLVGLLLLDVAWSNRLFVTRRSLDRECAERERERADLQARVNAQAEIITKLTDNFMIEVVPALTRSTDVAKEYVQLLQERGRRDHT